MYVIVCVKPVQINTFDLELVAVHWSGRLSLLFSILRRATGRSRSLGAKPVDRYGLIMLCCCTSKHHSLPSWHKIKLRDIWSNEWGPVLFDIIQCLDFRRRYLDLILENQVWNHAENFIHCHSRSRTSSSRPLTSSLWDAGNSSKKDNKSTSQSMQNEHYIHHPTLTKP